VVGSGESDGDTRRFPRGDVRDTARPSSVPETVFGLWARGPVIKSPFFAT
jgi:hypothetical protein